MKRCPECRRDYSDDTLLYCLEDGAALIQGSVPVTTGEPEEPATAILHETAPSGETPTRAQIHVTDRSAVLPTGTSDIVPKAGGFDKRLILAPIALALVVLGSFLGYRYLSPPKQIESIAVMPFVNESGDSDVEYLSDGMTETLIKSLSNLPNLNVKPRSSVFRYKGKDLDLQTIARELNVQAILTGRVVQRSDQVTLSLELVDVSKDSVIWIEQYNRKQSDLISLQSEIARDVSQKLKTKLSGADAAKVGKTYTANPDAYQLFLKGRYHATRYTEEGFKKGIEYFNQAIAIDPTYALAYDGLAYCYYSSWYIPAKEASPKAKAAAMKALEIDPSLAEAHASLATNSFWFEYDWAAAEREYKRSIELDPNYGYAHTSYGVLLAASGRFDEAVTEGKRGVELEPLSAELNTMLGIVYYYAKRYDLAAEQLNKTIELEPNFWWAQTYLARIYEKTGNISAAISKLEQAQKMDGATTEVSAALGRAYASAGKREESLKIINELNEPSNRIQMDGYEVAIIYAALGEKDQAFAYLDSEYSTGSWFLILIKVDPDLDPLRDDPRFKDLLKRMNLPQ